MKARLNRTTTSNNERANSLKKLLNILSVIAGASAYLYLIINTLKGTGEGLSLTTFGLWASLAGITSITMLKQGANPAVPATYGLGAATTAFILLTKGKYNWADFDTVVAIMVVLCVVLWLSSGEKPAFLLSVLAGLIAAVPFLLMTWKAPASSPIIPNTGFFIANLLSFVSAKKWTLQDRLYSGANTVLCAFLVLPWLMIQWR